jgi:hypothetical protein
MTSLSCYKFSSPPQVSAQFVLSVRRNIAIGREIHSNKIPFWIDVDPLAEVAMFPKGTVLKYGIKLE